MSNLAGAFFRQAHAAPGKAALICEDFSATYEDVAQSVRRLAASLAARGIRHGDHIGVALQNCPEFVLLMIAAADLGVVLVPVSPSLPPDVLRAAFAATGTRHLVATSDVLRSLHRSPDLDAVLLTIDEPDGDDSFPDIASLIAESASDPSPFEWGRYDDPLILSMTSGSTGAPKPIMLTQATKYNRALAAIDSYRITEADVTLAATPLYHSLAERLVFIPLLSGGTSVLMARFSPREWIAAVRSHRVSFTIAVSYQLRQIGRAIQPGNVIDSLRCVVSSSALLEIEAKSSLQARLRCDIHECYGTSELGIASTLDLSSAGPRLNSVGRAAAGVDVKIIDDDGRPVPTGAAGEIVCKSPMAFGGYFGRPDLTESAMWGDYVRTGDLGRLDAAGYLYFLGRKKETIITGGINVYPADIEAALNGYPGIVEAAAFAVPDERLGEVVGLAYVSESAQDFDLRRLRRHCGQRLADFQQPHKFVSLSALPRNAMGKLTRHALPELLLAAGAAGS